MLKLFFFSRSAKENYSLIHSNRGQEHLIVRKTCFTSIYAIVEKIQRMTLWSPYSMGFTERPSARTQDCAGLLKRMIERRQRRVDAGTPVGRRYAGSIGKLIAVEYLIGRSLCCRWVGRCGYRGHLFRYRPSPRFSADKNRQGKLAPRTGSIACVNSSTPLAQVIACFTPT